VNGITFIPSHPPSRQPEQQEKERGAAERDGLRESEQLQQSEKRNEGKSKGKSKGKGKARVELGDEASHAERPENSRVPDGFPLDTAHLRFGARQDSEKLTRTDDLYTILVPDFQQPAQPGVIIAVPVITKPKKQQPPAATQFHESLLDDRPPTPAQTSPIKRKQTPLFLIVDDEDDDEDEAESPVLRPGTRRSRNHRETYAFDSSPEMPPGNQESTSARSRQSDSWPPNHSLDFLDIQQSRAADSDEASSDCSEDASEHPQHSPGYRVSKSPSGSSRSRSTSKRASKHEKRTLPKVHTYSERRPRVYAPDFPGAWNPAQRLPLEVSPTPEWFQDYVRSKRHKSASEWPNPPVSNEREPLSELDEPQDERHNLARPRRRRNGEWPEAKVEGVFKPSSPDEGRRKPNEDVLRPFTKVWDVERNTEIPRWVEGEDVQMLEDRSKGKKTGAPTSGPADGFGPPAAKLKMKRTDTYQQNIDE